MNTQEYVCVWRKSGNAEGLDSLVVLVVSDKDLEWHIRDGLTRYSLVSVSRL